MEAPSVYIPIDRRHALVRGEALPDRTHGTALFADISGFTPLTEGLARALGPERGAEELTHHLNRVYDVLIAQVDRFGGSVIGFSGDAITCWYDGDDGRRTTASAIAIQNAMREFATVSLPYGGTVSFSVKVAVSAGPVRRFVVGDPSIQLIDILAGATLDRLAATERASEKGEVVLDEQTWHSVQSITQVREWRIHDSSRYAILSGLTEEIEPQPWLILSPDALSEEQVRPWLLAAIYERLTSGQGEFLAELRPAVALFLHFGGIDYDGDARAGEKLDVFIRRVQQIVARYEGTLIQLTFGDKGNYVFTTFGAPIAHDDDSARAVAAALDLRALPHELDFISDIRIGISRGRMRTGAYGGVTRRDYGVLGDEVNLAARLMERAAPGQIVVSERITMAVGSRYRFNPLGMVQVKGKQDAVRLFEALEKEHPKQIAAAEAEMIGRAAERAVLGEKLRALSEQKTSGVVFIEGEAGIGKSRLAEYSFQQAQGMGITALIGAGDAIEKSKPYHAWQPVFTQLFNLDALPEDKESRRTHVLSQLKSYLERDLLRFAPLLNVVLPLDLPDNSLTSQMSGQVRAENTYLLLSSLLQRAATQAPLLLLLEDAHWFDSASWALARHVARQVQPALQVIATRPLTEPIPPEYRNLLDEQSALRLALEPLPSEDIYALICQRLGVKALPDQVVTLIRDKAEGHPFFSEELAYALRDAGLILITDSQCQIAPNVDLKVVAFPDTVQGVITSRIDRLTPSQQLTIKVASVIGRVFAFRILRDTHPIDSDKPLLKDQLQVLERLDLTPLDTPDPDLAYIFKHIITQETAYSLLLFAQRRELHRAVAEWYEGNFSDDLSPFYPLLAYHWGKAEVVSKTIDYLEKAGDQAARNYANEEVIAFFDQALALARVQKKKKSGKREIKIDPSRIAHWERQLGEAHLGLGNLDECREHFHRALEFYKRLAPRAGVGLILSLLRQILVQVFHRLMPDLFFGRALANAVLLEAASIYLRLGEVYYLDNQAILTVDATFRALNLAEVAGLSPQLARAYANMCPATGLIPIHRAARFYGSRAREVSPKVNDLPALAHVLFMNGLYESFVGEWDKVQDDTRRALHIHGRLGDSRFRQVDLLLLALEASNQARFLEVLQLANDLYNLASRGNNIQNQHWGVLLQGLGQLRLGQLDQAFPFIETAITYCPKTGADHAAIVNTYALMGETHLHRSEALLAKEYVDMAMRKIVGSSRPTGDALLRGYAAVAKVYLSLWEMELGKDQNPNQIAELRANAKQVCQTFHRLARIFRVPQPAAWLAQGSYDWLIGNRTKAHQWWRKSLTAAADLKMPYDEALAHYEIGRHSADSQRQQHLMRACEILEELGTAFELAQAKEALTT